MGDEQRYWPFVDREPPVPVFVDLSGLAAPLASGVRPTLGQRAWGVSLSQAARGTLVRWVRTDTGHWLGLVDLRLYSHNRQAHIDVRQLVRSDAIRPMA